MSLFDRDYFYQRGNPSWGRSPHDAGAHMQPGMTSAVGWLMIINASVMLGAGLLEHSGVSFFRHAVTIEYVRGLPVTVAMPSDFEKWFGLFTPYLIGRGFVWQFVTYQFLHGSFVHLFFNMFTLYMLGAALERQIGVLAFVRLYLLGGIFAGFVNMVPHIFVEYPTIGASGAVCAVVAAFGLLNPHARLMLFIWFFPVVIKARTLVIVYAVLTALQALGSNDGVAHLAHLGGLIFGWMYVYNIGGMRGVIDGGRERVGSPHPGFSPRVWWEAARRVVRRPKRYRGEDVEDAEFRDAAPRGEWDARIDAILDKMARHGMHTLTKEEWEILERFRR